MNHLHLLSPRSGKFCDSLRHLIPRSAFHLPPVPAAVRMLRCDFQRACPADPNKRRYGGGTRPWDVSRANHDLVQAPKARRALDIRRSRPGCYAGFKAQTRVGRRYPQRLYRVQEEACQSMWIEPVLLYLCVAFATAAQSPTYPHTSVQFSSRSPLAFSV